MQDSNNFETLISKWRRLSVLEELDNKQSVVTASMSGDSSNNQTLTKKDEENSLLVPEQSSQPSLIAASTVGSVVATEVPSVTVSIEPEEAQELIKLDKEDKKEEAGDSETVNKNNDSESPKSDKDSQTDKGKTDSVEKDKIGDKVDSVFLRSPPPHKIPPRSTASTTEEEDCGVKCLYYTLVCCDCVLM